jgi:small GTP-binding protein
MREAVGFLLVFSVIDHKSFSEIDVFIKQILRVKDKDRYPIVIVANKVDIVDRKVSVETVKDYSEKNKIPYIEASARLRKNIDESFHMLVREIRKYNNPEDEKNQKKKKDKNGKDKKDCIIA